MNAKQIKTSQAELSKVWLRALKYTNSTTDQTTYKYLMAILSGVEQAQTALMQLQSELENN